LDASIKILELTGKKSNPEISKKLVFFSIELQKRAQKHDQSKLENPEKEYFDKMTPKLANLTYGTYYGYEALPIKTLELLKYKRHE